MNKVEQIKEKRLVVKQVEEEVITGITLTLDLKTAEKVMLLCGAVHGSATPMIWSLLKNVLAPLGIGPGSIFGRNVKTPNGTLISCTDNYDLCVTEYGFGIWKRGD